MNIVVALLLTSTTVAPIPARESIVTASVRSARELVLTAPLPPAAPASAARAAATGPSKGAVIGGIVGGIVGAVAGVATSAHLAMKQCGGSCSDEKVLIGVSLVGMPLAGAFLGVKLFGR